MSSNGRHSPRVKRTIRRRRLKTSNLSALPLQLLLFPVGPGLPRGRLNFKPEKTARPKTFNFFYKVCLVRILRLAFSASPLSSERARFSLSDVAAASMIRLREREKRREEEEELEKPEITNRTLE